MYLTAVEWWVRSAVIGNTHYNPEGVYYPEDLGLCCYMYINGDYTSPTYAVVGIGVVYIV